MKGLIIIAALLPAALLPETAMAKSIVDRIPLPALTASKVPPTFSVGIRIGPYRPAIAPAGTDTANFFERQFLDGIGNDFLDRGPLMKTLEIDYFFSSYLGFSDWAGRLAANLSVAHWNVNGRALVCYNDATPSANEASIDCTDATVGTNTALPGNTGTSLTVVPVRLGLTYRADQLLTQLGVPLFAYGRLGLTWSYWVARVGGKVEKFVDSDGETQTGEGATWGLDASFGIAFNLDFLSPSPNTGDNVLGLVGSHLFVEANFTAANNFGAGPHKVLDLSDITGSAGLALDFH